MKNLNINALTLIIALVIISFWGGSFVTSQNINRMHHHNMDNISMDNMSEHRTELLAHRDGMMDHMKDSGNYRCCLEKPCSYCIEKTPGHGEGATCDCLADIIAGKHPCGECIGEILEGHGNKYLSEYFAAAISEEVGEKYIDIFREIISSKYDITIEDQK